VCVISYRLWQRSFGGDRNAIGRKVQMNGQPFTILGVAPKEFSGLKQGTQTDVFVPLMAVGMSQYVNFLETFGRLKPGVSVAQAEASLDVLYHQFETRQPRAGKLSDMKIVLQPGRQGFSGLRGRYERTLLILMVVVALVLLIACANVTNLLMARASGRAKEIAVRLALGARRPQLVQQLLVESMLLTIIGAALGMALAYWIDHALVALAPGGALILDVHPDWHVFLFTLGVAIVVSLLSGIGPAIQSTHPDVAPVLKGEASARIARRFSFTNALVVAEVALSLVLLIGAGLFLRSLHNLKSVDPGFDPGQLVVLTIEPGINGYSQAQTQSFFERLMERARHVPGVLALSPGLVSPLSGDFSMTGISVADYQPQPNERPIISTNWVGPEYFKALRTPLVAGRVFTEQDGGANKVAIVNEKAAKHFWPHASPIGKHAVIGGRDRTECEIVGVVKDVKSESLREEAQATVYLPFRQNPRPRIALHVRVTGKTAPVIAALIRESHALDANMPVFNATTMEAQLDRTIALDRLMAALTALFGILAVALAAVGLYGVMALAVSARTRELGIRMALGASQARVLGQVMRESAVLAIIGIGLGVPGAMWASRGVGSFLYGLSATDPWTYALLALMLLGVTLSAAWIPARPAARVDPMVALRYE